MTTTPSRRTPVRGRWLAVPVALTLALTGAPSAGPAGITPAAAQAQDGPCIDSPAVAATAVPTSAATAGATTSGRHRRHERGPVGFASVTGRTTGGRGGRTVIVSTLDDFIRHAASPEPLTIRVAAIISLTGQVAVASDKTVVGVGTSGGFTGGGLLLDGVHNIIIRNLTFSFPVGTDSITLIREAHHVWVDHNEFFSDCDHGIDFYDGLVDITRASNYVTVSWNRMHDHFKVSLVGHSDANEAQDAGTLKVTYHHNWVRNFSERGPSVRFGTAHVFNNLMENGNAAAHSRMGAQMLVQNNVYRGVAVPVRTIAFSPVDGFVNMTGNDFGTGKNDITQTGTMLRPPYRFRLDPTADVPALVTTGTGVGIVG